MYEAPGWVGFCGALILLLPLLAAAVVGAGGTRLPGRTAGWIVAAASATGFALAVILFFRLMSLEPAERSEGTLLYQWMSIGGLHVPLGLLLDPLSITWTLFVTGVGSVIVVYSIGYMEGERGFARYFSFLALFLFSMLALVLGDNLVVTFLGWEGVGLCSYLLIGFDYDKDTAAYAGRKAFLVNRIGDVGFLLGMFWVFRLFGTVTYAGLGESLASQTALPTLLGLCFFLAAVGKSAQLPLFVWLPDAMAGPTPVSALIHAATMVTAGVYLLCRTSLLFVLAGSALTVVVWTGALTALLAGLIALRQTDIKRVLAYSTVSQLGYMFVACGVGAFSGAVFHVVTHAFFKALLFLGAGAVIHGLHGEQDLRKMGGLKESMPQTYKAMLWGSFALAGIPIFAGFFSKDEILAGAFATHQYAIWGLGVVTAILTAFYTSRMMTLCFLGKSRVPEDVHPHEAPPLMGRPLTVLKWLSLFAGGVLGFEMLHWRPLHDWVTPVLQPATALLGEHELSGLTGWLLLILAAVLALLSWGIARSWYLADSLTLRQLEVGLAPLARLIQGRFFVDELYDRTIVRPLHGLAVYCSRVDMGLVDGLYRWIARTAALLGSLVRVLQNGLVHTYAFWFLVGAALVLYMTVTG